MTIASRRLYRSRCYGLRFLSSSPSVAPVKSVRVIPVRHSRKQPLPVCTDPVQLAAWTDELIQAPTGSLYSYRENDIDAWENADASVQKAECVLRGHAATVPGTLWWHRTASSRDSDIKRMNPDTLKRMEQVVQRLWTEGETYMTVRDQRLTELHGIKNTTTTTATTEETTPPPSSPQQEETAATASLEEEEEEKDWDEATFDIMKQLGMTDESSPVTSTTQSSSLGLDGASDNNAGSYMNDFSYPGPTVVMYDTLLDALACAPKPSFDDTIIHLNDALRYFEHIELRHQWDGGDMHNTNRHTLPTVLSFNAPIRLAAQIPDHDEEIRDYALQLAMTTFSALTQSKVAQLNSASFNYLLQTITCFLPPSRIRTNICRGIWTLAARHGVADETVTAAAADIDVERQQKHWRNYKKRRFHVHESLY